MPKVRYVGPHEAVEIDLPDGSLAVCERDSDVEVPSEVAKSLLEQEDNWKTAKGGGKAKSAREE